MGCLELKTSLKMTEEGPQKNTTAIWSLEKDLPNWETEQEEKNGLLVEALVRFCKIPLESPPHALPFCKLFDLKCVDSNYIFRRIAPLAFNLLPSIRHFLLTVLSPSSCLPDDSVGVFARLSSLHGRNTRLSPCFRPNYSSKSVISPSNEGVIGSTGVVISFI